MASPIPIRPIRADEHDAFLDVVSTAMGSSRSDEAGRLLHGLTMELDRTLGAFDGDQLVGTAQGVSFSMSVPGGADVATCGIKSVDVLPTHRRRGLLTALMGEQLGAARERGEALSILWPTESGIYPRFGYAPGTMLCSYLLQLGPGGGGSSATAFLPGVDLGDGRARLVPAEKAVETVRPVHDGMRSRVPGMWERNEAWWQRWAHDPSGSATVVVIESPADGALAYARYTVSSQWGHTGPANDLSVSEMLALTPSSAAALWRYLLDVDLVATVSAWHRPLDDPLPWLLSSSRRLERHVRDGVWLRILDVPTALTARRYRAPLSVVIEVADEQVAQNTGRWQLDGSPDGATCVRTAAAADLVLEISSLSAAYLGGHSLSDLAASGRVRGDAQAIADADLAFTWRPHPWAVTWF